MTEVYKEKTTLDGVPLEIVGISQDTPIYPMADVKLYSRIIINYDKNGQKIGEVCFEEKFDKEKLIEMVKIAVSDKEGAISNVVDKTIIDIIKKSKDYKDEPK